MKYAPNPVVLTVNLDRKGGMFLRKHLIRRGKRTYVYYRLCRTVRQDGEVRQEAVANLGKLSDEEAIRIGNQLLHIAGKAPPPGPRRSPTSTVQSVSS